MLFMCSYCLYLGWWWTLEGGAADTHGDTARSSAQCKDGPRGLGDQCCYIVNCSYHSNEGMEGAGPQWCGTHSLFVILHLWRGRELRAAPNLGSSSRRLWATSWEEQRSVSSYSRLICEELMGDARPGRIRKYFIPTFNSFKRVAV